jgi:hypothetical protein
MLKEGFNALTVDVVHSERLDLIGFNTTCYFSCGRHVTVHILRARLQ